MKAERVANDNAILDFKNSGHTVYDIGFKRDTAETVHGYFSDLMVYKRELSENEITNLLFLNHPLRTLV